MWLQAEYPCKCGWVADPVKEIDNTECKCYKCGAVYDKRPFGCSLRQKSFEERLRDED